MINIQSPHWYAQLVLLQNEVGHTSFLPALSKALSQIIRFNCSGLISYNNGEVTCIYEGDFTPHYKKYIELYLKGLYLLDPHYSFLTKGANTGLYRFRDIAPDRYRYSDYYNAFIKPVGITDEYDFIVKIDSRYINFFIDNLGGTFSKHEVATLSAITPLITYMLESHWKISNQELEVIKEPPSFSHTPNIFDSFGTSFLTEREQGVMKCILHGHSTKSLAIKLGISPSTVKTHRKNIYKKLDISSQSELFSLCIQALSIKKLYESDDPLEAMI